MKCKFCDVELGEDEIICPACGKNNAGVPVEEAPAEETLEMEVSSEQTPQAETPTEKALEETAEELSEQPKKPKKKKWIRLTAIICCVVLVLGLCAAAWYDFNGGWIPGENNIHFRSNYTRSAWRVKLAANRVVATIGDRELTNAELQVLYWMQFYNYVSNYGITDALDVEKPFADQKVPNTEDGEDISWEQYFLELSLENWHRYQALVLEAEKQGFEMSEDYADYLETLPEEMDKRVQELGYEDLDDYLRTMVGPGADPEVYLAYLDLANRGEAYYSSWYEAEDPTRDEVSAFFDKYAEDFSSLYGVTRETGKLVDVRHILLEPEVTENADGSVVITDAQWEQCRAQAQALLDEWAKDGSEEAFAKLANEKSVDEGSNTEGGLYSYVPKDYMVKEFDAWIFDESRKAGDTGLVKTDFGYHIMYYVGGDEAWYLFGREALVSERCSEKLTALVQTVPMEVNYRAIVLGQADMERMAE
ncbi:MAG: peptidylprolyl isomerase [Oscillospiraceae bacterium]|nr:peptidylprolyl isomerase [Oscillospiraceae bacterium]